MRRFWKSASTCGALLLDLEFPGRLKNVCIKDHRCNDMIEKLYYSYGFEPICFNCGCDVTSTDDSNYLPMCNDQGLIQSKSLLPKHGTCTFTVL